MLRKQKRAPSAPTITKRYLPPYSAPRPPRSVLPPSVTDTRGYYEELDAAVLSQVLGTAWTPSAALTEMIRMPNARCLHGVWTVKWGDVLRHLFPRQYHPLRWREDALERRTPFPAWEERGTEDSTHRGLAPYIPEDIDISFLSKHHDPRGEPARKHTPA